MPRVGPIEYTLDTERRIVSILYLENPDGAAWVAAIEAITRDPEFSPGFDFYADRRGVPEAPTVAFVDESARYLRSRPEIFAGRRWAVVTGTLLGFGMARMGKFRAVSAGLEVEAFRNPDEAMAWLLQLPR